MKLPGQTDHFLNDAAAHDAYMALALEQALLAQDRDEVPIGAVLVNMADGQVVAEAGNATRAVCDPTAHAEIAVIRQRCAELGAQRIPGHVLYVTLEPCPMCAAAISFARIDRVVYGAHDPKSGGLNMNMATGPRLYTHAQLHHKPDVVSGIKEQECGALLSAFFARKRQDKRA